MKRFFILLSIVALALICGCILCACNNTPEQTPATGRWDANTRFLDSEIYVPENSRIGFYYVSEDGESYIKANYGATATPALFDPTRPTIIFFHGMQVNSGYHHDEGMGSWYQSRQGLEDDYVASYLKWKEAGYNTLAYNYSAYADDGVIEIISKIWGFELEGIGRRWAYADENDQKVYETEDIPNAGLVEIFAKEYAAIMQDYSGTELRFACHSMGGQFCLAAADIINRLDDRGEIPHRLMPDRITFIDPYIERQFIQPEGTVNYAGEAYTCSYDIAMTLFPLLYAKGTAIEYFDGEIGYRLTAGTRLTGEYFDQLTKLCAYIDYEIVPNGYVNNYLAILGDYHNVTREAYLYSICEDIPVDSTVEDSGNYSLSAALPTEILDSYRGNVYRMEETATIDITDDLVTMISPRTGGTVFGYAFHDVNGNGVRDEDYTARIQGVKVTLYNAEDNEIAVTTTDSAGRYRFDGLTAGEYYCVFAVDEYTPTAQSEPDENLRNSDISAEGVSGTVTLPTNVSYGYINAGYVK